jgi:hypothetical protein
MLGAERIVESCPESDEATLVHHIGALSTKTMQINACPRLNVLVAQWLAHLSGMAWKLLDATTWIGTPLRNIQFFAFNVSTKEFVKCRSPM